MKVGIAVYCAVCHLRKKPRGRSAPLEMANSLCDSECPGWRMEPRPGDLWPGETADEFGYPCGDEATEESGLIESRTEENYYETSKWPKE